MKINTDFTVVAKSNSRYVLAQVVCLLYPELSPAIDHAIEDAILAAMPPLEALARRSLRRHGWRMSELAEDVVANWMLRICDSDLIHRYDPKRGKPAAFFGRIMELVALETIRPFKRQVTNVDWEKNPLEFKPEAGEGMMRAELLRLARERYLSLSPQQKKAVRINFPFLDEGDADSGVASAPDDKPRPPKPSYASVSRGKRAVVDYVKAMTA